MGISQGGFFIENKGQFPDNVLFNAKKVDFEIQKELSKGQNNYLEYRKSKDPARPMLKALFGHTFTESFINNLLFKIK